jgi:protein-L-isoaspartate(D-aspartate) O-methyltransferase
MRYHSSILFVGFNLRSTVELLGYFLCLCHCLSAGLSLRAQQSVDPYEARRNWLVDNVIVPGGVKNPAVLKSIRTTARHDFVPREHLDKAYLDMAIAIGEKQTISSPFIVAFMTEALQPKPTDRVLEIGTGSGYQAAVLSPLVKDVYTIEIVEDLGQRTMDLLAELGYENVHCLIGDGYKGWPEFAPFDKIIVTCSPDRVPEALGKQLKEGGLMVIPVGDRYQQMLYLMRKKNGKLEKDELTPTLFVPMTGAAEQQRQVQPNGADPVLLNTSFEEPLIRNYHVPGWYYQFGCIQVEDSGVDGKYAVEFRSVDPNWPNMLLQGIPLDGTKVRKIKLGGSVMTKDVKMSRDRKTPTIAIQYFNSNRDLIGVNYIDGFKGTRGWKRTEKIFPVPQEAKEAIVSIGLFGAEGMARFDNIVCEPVSN